MDDGTKDKGELGASLGHEPTRSLASEPRLGKRVSHSCQLCQYVFSQRLMPGDKVGPVVLRNSLRLRPAVPAAKRAPSLLCSLLELKVPFRPNEYAS